MNINAIYRHPAELEAEAMLSRGQPYPEDFTLAERTVERMTRARNGLAVVMTDLSPRLDDEQAAIVHCWLDKVLAIVDMARIDAEASV
ncbi:MULTISPECIES: nicotinic acetylcholine receptor subunit beta [Klebsiella/Raoultella group]|uniref:nicotinic acetylcholine receptor subunit beta n=1 Tax=Klebsiella/Raoultella group TaxID=2890311 RepID=UPI0010BE35C9|nr:MULTISPECIES: nicotinic acetylcholine receptor subunit beta [Klebsiella/Raoultella group]HDU4472163.1 nicotinic acetylcholine receptor subunit beta [Klebsiella pneumoniae subsp. pneumoniae]MDV1908468.1 nicotinic acetylcholine receptor subunit beta [Klebsiella pasteurii]MDV1914312.1 nicotinic acetylcholine receptor subunit beta [Klebsiella pasteurii]QCK79185.1 nicotinic acetylcholine receptor subunit beta [Raoultella ornithinolytica]QHO87206.1 nicotinic acetylcholine receptor subunit beta [K